MRTFAGFTNVFIVPDNNEASIDLQAVKASYAPPERLDNSAAIFTTSPKKKNPKRRIRKIDLDRKEERRAKRKATKDYMKTTNEVDVVEAYGKYFNSFIILRAGI
jgi:guanylate kinase